MASVIFLIWMMLETSTQMNQERLVLLTFSWLMIALAAGMSARVFVPGMTTTNTWLRLFMIGASGELLGGSVRRALWGGGGFLRPDALSLVLASGCAIFLVVATRFLHRHRAGTTDYRQGISRHDRAA